MKVYLASQSPRRQALLKQINIAFDTLLFDIDETPKSGENAEQMALRLARAKATKGWQHNQRTAHLPVLAADTIGLLAENILLKPQNKTDFITMLSSMSGKTHQVLTAVAVCFNGNCESIISKSMVTFAKLSQAEILDYWDSGEPRDKAGGYAIQGLGGRFVTRIEGSYSGIVGLPLYQTWKLLQKVRQ